MYKKTSRFHRSLKQRGLKTTTQTLTMHSKYPHRGEVVYGLSNKALDEAAKERQLKAKEEYERLKQEGSKIVKSTDPI
jgi:hypothetical protein